MCLLEVIYILRFRSCLQLYWEYRQKEKGALPSQHTQRRRSWSCGSAAHSPRPREGPRWKARRDPSAPRHAALSTMSHPGTHARLFQTAPKPASLHRFHPTQPAPFLQAEPAAACSALPCPSHHIPDRPCLFASPFRPGHNFSPGWYCSMVSPLTLLVY